MVRRGVLLGLFGGKKAGVGATATGSGASMSKREPRSSKSTSVAGAAANLGRVNRRLVKTEKRASELDLRERFSDTTIYAMAFSLAGQGIYPKI